VIFGIKVPASFLPEEESVVAIELSLSIGSADEYNDIVFVFVFGIPKENPSQHEKNTTKKISCSSVDESSMIRIVVSRLFNSNSLYKSFNKKANSSPLISYSYIGYTSSRAHVVAGAAWLLSKIKVLKLKKEKKRDELL
jgi:hypothetical protein